MIEQESLLVPSLKLLICISAGVHNPLQQNKRIFGVLVEVINLSINISIPGSSLEGQNSWGKNYHHTNSQTLITPSRGKRENHRNKISIAMKI